MGLWPKMFTHNARGGARRAGEGRFGICRCCWSISRTRIPILFKNFFSNIQQHHHLSDRAGAIEGKARRGGGVEGKAPGGGHPKPRVSGVRTYFYARVYLSAWSA